MASQELKKLYEPTLYLSFGQIPLCHGRFRDIVSHRGLCLCGAWRPSPEFNEGRTVVVVTTPPGECR